MKQGTPDSQGFLKWHRNTQVAISNAFEKERDHREEFDQIRFLSFGGYVSQDYGDRVLREQTFLQGLNEAEALLESMIHEIDEYWPEDSDVTTVAEPLVSNQVFVVHGRDEAATQTVARFLESLDLEPVILQEQPNASRTIIEKFEDYSQVGFAVILCTPDDIGALVTEQENLKSRPRQNVVLEWGFFLGRLGRGRVCALLKGDVEIPSDYSGVVYVEMDDSQGWQIRLLRELRNAGLQVDANKLF